MSGPKYFSPLSVNLYPSFLRLVFSIDLPKSLALASKSFMYEFLGPKNLVNPEVIAPPISAAYPISSISLVGSFKTTGAVIKDA